MQINMAIVGVPNVTVTAFSSLKEDIETESIRRGLEMKGKKPRDTERYAFDQARRRFAQQGASETKYFMI